MPCSYKKDRESLSPWLNCKSEILPKFLHLGRTTICPKGNVLYAPGDRVNKLWYIKEGQVRCSIIGANGQEKIIGFLGEGAIIGEGSFLNSLPSQLMIFTSQPSTLVYFPRESIMEIISHEPTFSIELLNAIHCKSRVYLNEIEGLSFYTSPQRICRFICNLADQYGTDVDKGVRVDIRLTHQQIADIIGVSRVTVTNVLQELRSVGIFDISGNRIIMDRANCQMCL